MKTGNFPSPVGTRWRRDCSQQLEADGSTRRGGTKPADLPVEQLMKFKFIVNPKTAKQIGVTNEPNLLIRADRGSAGGSGDSMKYCKGHGAKRQAQETGENS